MSSTSAFLHPLAQWSPQILSILPYHALNESFPTNVTAAAGNTYKNMYEATTMNSGLSVVVLINLVTSWLGVLFYRYVILREAGLLSPEEIQLLSKYSIVPGAQRYTPSDAYIRAAPPMRWTGWQDFFASSDSTLSKDAQVYLLFQRACIVTTAICALFASLLLLPSYWLGGAVFKTDADKAPHSLLSLLKSDRGVFERFTSHNLPPESPLYMLQLPVFVVTAFCIVVLYTVVKAAAGEERSLEEWLSDESSASQSGLSGNFSDVLTTSRRLGRASPNTRSPTAGKRIWTLFARGLPCNIHSSGELVEMLEAIYPGQVVNVELVCRGRTSEARLLRSLSWTRNRLEYLHDTDDDQMVDERFTSHTLFGRVFGLFAKRRSKAEMVQKLEEKIESMKREVETRKVEPVRDFLGCAFISFSSSAAARAALNDFPIKIDENSPDMEVRSTSREGNVVDITIGRHTRVSSRWGIPGLHNLYKGTVNLLPQQLRHRVLSSSSSTPSFVREEQRLHQRMAGVREGREQMTAEIATTRLRRMKAERAPKSRDIIWRNIGISFFERTVREMIVQVLVFTVLILFTSPVAMLTAMKLIFAEVALLSDPAMIFGNMGNHHNSSTIANGLNGTHGSGLLNISSDGNAVESMSENFMNILPSFFTSNTFLRTAILAYLPVLMLAIVFAIVPSLLRLTCALEGYPTHSGQEMSVFRKTSFYYVMNSVVLPSLALNTASEFLEMIYKQSEGGANVYNALPVLQRLFSGDIAFFLCNYLVQLALTGSVLWLMRIPSSFSMMIRRRIALTPLETAEAKCTDIFDYPRHYAYGVTVMSMCLLFGFMAPLIWWFALLYFVCKHFVDTYTIRYVHPRSHMDGRLPRLSANFILTWTTVSQLSLAMIFYLQGWVRAGVATAFLCLLTLACCLSVRAHVGNRIVQIIARIRDRVIEKLLSLGGDGYEWMPTPSLLTSSSTSSSTQSLAESTEGDALLGKQSQASGSKAVENFGNKLWGDDNKQAAEGDVNMLTRSQNGKYGRDIACDPVTPDSEDPAIGEDSDSDREVILGVEDVEDGRTNRVRQYGTCDDLRRTNKWPKS